MKLRVLLSLLACFLFISCGSDRDAHAPTEWPPANWTFQVNGQAPVIYSFSGGTMGVASKPGFPNGVAAYQKNGNNSGILTISFILADGTNQNEVYQLSFSSQNGGTFSLNVSVTNASGTNQQQSNGTFHK